MNRIPDTVRQTVRERGLYRCEYCLKPEFMSASQFHVDHIRPPMHGGDSELHNLAWACVDCNVHKGTNIASYDHITGEMTPLFNPRIYQWKDHFALTNAEIIGITTIGRITVRLLDVNSPHQIQARRIVLDLERRGLYTPPEGSFRP